MKTTHIQDLAIIDVKKLKFQIEMLDALIDNIIYDPELTLSLKSQKAILNDTLSHLFSLEEAISDAYTRWSDTDIFVHQNMHEAKEHYLSQDIKLKPHE